MSDPLESAEQGKESSERPGLSFRLKLTLLAVSMALIPVAIVGLVSMNVNKKALESANRDLLFSVLHAIAEAVEGRLEDDRASTRLAAATLLNSDAALDQRLSVLRALVGGGQLESLAIYDEELKLVDTIVPEEGSKRTSYSAALQPSLVADAEQDVFVVPTATGEGVQILARARGSDAIWYVATKTNLDAVQRTVEVIGHERLGRGHSLLLVDNSLRVLADSQIERRGQPLAESDRAILQGLTPEVFDKGALVFGEVTSSGRAMLGAVRTLPSVPWAVAVEVPRDVAYMSVSRIRFVLLGVVVLASLVALIVAIIMARRISAPLQTLVAYAGDLANRRFDKRVTVRTRDELSVLGKALSSAASQLEESDKRIQDEVRIRADLGRYLPTGLVDRIVEEKQALTLGGERREVTVLFADIVGFTPLAECHAAENVVALLNDFFTLITEIIFRHGGTVDKFIGDSVMAFWGAPNPQPDQAELALRAAEDMIRWLEIANEGWSEKFGITVQIAIGVNTGEAVVGNFGSNERMDYTLIGDCVNVAARLETIARPGQILVSAAAKDAAGDAFDFIPLGTRDLVGRRERVELFEVVL